MDQAIPLLIPRTEMLSKIKKSLSARLILLFTTTGIVLLVVVSMIMGHGFSRHFNHNVKPFLVHYANLLKKDLGSPPDEERAKILINQLPADIYVFGPDGDWATSKQPLNPAELTKFPLRRRTDHERVHPLQFLRNDDDLVIHTRDEDHDIYFRLHEHRRLTRKVPAGMFVLAIIAATLLFVYLATRSLFRPIQEIRAGVRRIGSGELDHRIARYRNDELGELTDSVNAMADDIRGMLESKRELLLAISHELRSPLTRSRVNLALLEETNARDEIEKDIGQMEELITELLESERLNSRYASLQTETTDLSALVRELIDDEYSTESISLDLSQLPIHALLDPLRIKLLLRNLINNAIKHSDAEVTSPAVKLSLEGDMIQLSVIDHGRGIDAAHIPYLTEPFYRADPSRQRKTGGYGLGLYLCRMIVEAHAGQLKITSEPGVGTRIDSLLPLVSAKKPAE